MFGAGRVGTALAAEMPGAALVRRGEDCRCDVACVAWPAQAVADFARTHPLGAEGHKITFCNGCWATVDGADEAGVCYVRLCNRGDRAPPGRRGWRCPPGAAARLLRGAGAGVVESRTAADHAGHLWGKALYLLPLALAAHDLGGLTGRNVVGTPEYAEWYDVVREASVAAVGATATEKQEPRVRFLIQRTPRGWHPSPSPEELAYFRRRLGCAG